VKSELADPIISANSYYNEDTAYNEKLDSVHVDIPGNEDSVKAELVMIISSKVGSLISPKFLIVLFRIQKALTSFCLLLTIIAELVWLVVMMIIGEDLFNIIGGRRDAVLRVFGVVLAVLSFLIEQDVMIVDYVPIMKLFLMRFLSISFISVLACTHTVIGLGLGFGFLNGDGVLVLSGFYGFAVLFQAGVSHALSLCSFTYLIMGLLCLDRFTADAFLAEESIQIQTGINGNISMTNMDGDDQDSVEEISTGEDYPVSEMSMKTRSNGNIMIQTDSDADRKEII